MIYEFAVSPALFNSGERVSQLYHAFGMEPGRLISDFPRLMWSRLALEVVKRSASGDLEQKKWCTALESLQKRAMYEREDSQWNGENWLNSAVDEHHRRPFRGILHDDQCNEPSAIKFGIDMADHPNWKCDMGRHVLRNANQIVSAVAPLLALSTTLVLIDPFFSPIDGRWLNVLLGFARWIAENPVRPKIMHIDCITSTRREVTDQRIEQDFRDFFGPDLPPGVSVGGYVVQQSLLHDRFVLTERGGVQFGRGLDEGPGEVLITRLGDRSYEKEWDNALRIRTGMNPAVRHRFRLRGA